MRSAPLLLTTLLLLTGCNRICEDLDLDGVPSDICEAWDASDPIPTGYVVEGAETDCNDSNPLVVPGAIVNLTTDTDGYATIQTMIDYATDGDSLSACYVDDATGIVFYDRNNLSLEGYGTSTISGALQSGVMIQDSTSIAVAGIDVTGCSADGTVLVPDGSQDNDKGAGGWVNNSTGVSFTDMTIQGNYSLDSGGGLYLNGSIVTLENVDLDANNADDSGSNMHVRGASWVHVTNGSVVNAPDHNGVFIDDEDVITEVAFNSTLFDANVSDDIVVNSTNNTYTFGGSWTGVCSSTGACY